MRTQHICDKCGRAFDDWDDAWNCEHSHLAPDSYTDVTSKSLMYKKGKRIPESLILGFDEEDKPRTYALYKFAREYTLEEGKALEADTK